jgi:hypothetical protein
MLFIVFIIGAVKLSLLPIIRSLKPGSFQPSLITKEVVSRPLTSAPEQAVAAAAENLHFHEPVASL